MPRQYTLGKRAAQKAETKARILAATLALYQEVGAEKATIKAIAARADVAPATVLNHFPGPNDLAEAAAEVVLAELRPPTPEIFAGLESTSERITRLAQELSAFYARGEPWWRLYDRDETLSDSWRGAEASFYESLDRLIKAALGPDARDETAVSVVWAILGAPVFVGLQSRGMAVDEVATLSADLIVRWLDGR